MDRPAVFEFGAFDEALEASRSSDQVLGEEERSLSWCDRIKDALPPGLEVSRLEHWLGAPLKSRQRWADLARRWPRPCALLG